MFLDRQDVPIGFNEYLIPCRRDSITHAKVDIAKVQDHPMQTVEVAGCTESHSQDSVNI